jgi:short-subunit dehydrogenase
MAGPGTQRRGTALITGASSGIGRAFAREFARNGFDVVLVARREGPLREAAAQITGEFGVRALPHVLDLADPAAPTTIVGLLDRGGIEVDALVNNAGFGVPGMLSDVDWQRHADCIEVMARAPTHLCYLLAPGMAARRRGWIVNVSSLTAFLPPHAGGTLYYPVKAFMLNLSLALRAEVRRHGVHVTAVCPGFTETGFQEAAGGTVESVAFPRRLWLTAERVARAGYADVMRDRAICIPGTVNRMIALAFKLMPGALGRWIVRGDS